MNAKQSKESDWHQRWMSSPDWDAEPDLEALRKARASLDGNPGKAIKELESLASEGSLVSTLYLGDAFYALPPPTRDLEKARFWYQKASEDGDAATLHLLGRVCFDLGDWPAAFVAFSDAAAQGYTPSVHRLGCLYLKGRGTQADLGKAESLIARASSDGHLLAKRDRAKMYCSGDYGSLRIPYGLCLLTLFIGQLVSLALRDRSELERRII